MLSNTLNRSYSFQFTLRATTTSDKTRNMSLYSERHNVSIPSDDYDGVSTSADGKVHNFETFCMPTVVRYMAREKMKNQSFFKMR